MIDQLLVILYWGLPSLSLAFALTILIILGLSKKDNLIKSFMFMMISMAVWSSTSLLMKMNVAPGTLFWNRFMVAALVMIPFGAYIFFTIYIRMKRRLSIFFWTIMIGIILILNSMGLTTLTAEMVATPGVSPYVELQYEIGIASYFCYGAIFALLVVCLILARKEYKSAKPYTTGLKNIIVALFILFIGFGANLVPVIGKYPIDFAAGAIASVYFMTAIYKNRVLELKFVITKAVIFTALLTAITIGSIYAVNALISTFNAMNTGLDQNLFILVVTFVSLLVFQPLFKMIYNLVNNFFYKDENRRNNLIKHFTLRIANNLDLGLIIEDLMRVISEVSSNERNYIFLRNMDEDRFDFYASGKKLDRVAMSFANTHPIVRWFEQTDDIIFSKNMDTHPFFKTMWDTDRMQLNQILMEAAIPLKYNSKLIGILVMCSKDIRSIKDIDNIEQLSMVCVTASIAISNARLYEKAKTEAQMDAVTSVFNYRYFMDKLISVTADRKRGTTAVCLVGLDMFTVYNDIYGHYAGDAVLIKVASIIKQVCGSYGTISRYAGDIFAVVLPFMDTKQSYEMMEKIRSQVEGSSMSPEEDTPRHVTVSIGISVFPNQSKDDKELLKHTTLALSEAKKTGRNKTVIYNSEMEELGHSTNENDENQMATIYALTAAIDAKDHFTFGHSQRVAKYATAIAEAMGAKSEEVEIIRQASLLHDIGKIGISENVLTKMTRLTTDEYETMKKHVDLSITIIKYLPSFNKVIPSVIGHHERWDGKGYPRRIKGDNIAFGARCIAISDAFDAITSDRHYKSYMSIEYALEEILRNAGSQFDPVMAEMFVRLVKEGRLIVEPTRSNQYAKTSSFEQTIS